MALYKFAFNLTLT